MLLALLGTLCFADNNSISDREIQSLYDGANEMEMLNSSMERGIQQHNQTTTQPIETQIVEETIEENNPISGFKEEANQFYYEETIPNSENTTVNIDVDGYKVIIRSKTTHKEEIKEANGMHSIHSSSSSKMELTIPYNADMNKVEKSYKDGIVKIVIPKKKEFPKK